MFTPLSSFLAYFYPRPLRGGRPTATVNAYNLSAFLSTPSARRATWDGEEYVYGDDISIHALCEEGDLHVAPDPPRDAISIHALCEEGDPPVHSTATVALIFLSTPSARRATRYGRPLFGSVEDISIHALCEEGDTCPTSESSTMTRFLSTPSARRATRRCRMPVSS